MRSSNELRCVLIRRSRADLDSKLRADKPGKTINPSYRCTPNETLFAEAVLVFPNRHDNKFIDPERAESKGETMNNEIHDVGDTRLLRAGYGWSAWVRDGYPDTGEDVTWAQFRDQVEEDLYYLSMYWSQASDPVRDEELYTRLRQVGIERFVKHSASGNWQLDAGEFGMLEFALSSRAGGATMDLVAHRTCSVCGEVCQSMPLTNELHVWAFACGDDTPCACNVKKQIAAEQEHAAKRDATRSDLEW